MDIVYDYLVVGAGSAGCVLANRLSAAPAVSVLLLEAADDHPPAQQPADVLDPYPLSSYNAGYFWPDLKAYWKHSGHGKAVKFPQARVMGGGSAVAGTVAFRGSADDYDEWAADGATGWSWQDVLPYFRRLETDMDFDGPAHGRSGPIPIRRIAPQAWPPLTQAIAQHAAAIGLPQVADMNADFRDGFGVTPISSRQDVRVTTAAGYLDDSVRRRPNLHIRTRVVVQRLLWEGRRAVGVAAICDGHTLQLRARELILSTGTIHSPLLLQRSGVGDGALLQSLGVEVVAHRPGVGRNLQNHAVIFLGALLRRGSRQAASLQTHPTCCMRLSSDVPGAHRSDLYVNIQSKTSWNAMGSRLASLNAVLQKPRGSGRVQITSADAAQPPLIEFGFGDHAGDLQALSKCLLHVIRLLASPQVSPHIGRPFVVRVGDRIRAWNAHTPANARQARVFATLIDAMPRSLADRVLSRVTGDATDLDALARNDDALLAFVQREISGVYHPVGTCRIGQPRQTHAVVDPDGRVIGVEGLRVADASVMPSLPRGNTNIPSIMVGEKMSDHILRTAAR